MRIDHGLPVPGREALIHSRAVGDLIRRRLADAGGWIDFAAFMDLVLYAPGFGYYSAGSRKFGPAGDFVTAPEISPLFARCLARLIAPALEHCGGVVLELGAGTGVMAVDLLSSLAAAGALPDRYLILEVSAELRDRQQRTLRARLPDLGDRVEWLDTPPSPGLHGVIVANEVMDALPVRRFSRRDDGVVELGVAAADHEFRWAARPATGALRDAVNSIERDLGGQLPAGYASEVCLALHPWLKGLAAALERGVLLLVDYGLPRRAYYHPQRSTGTLRCHYRQRAHDDPFVYPGLQDITAWVDFTAVAAAADAADLAVAGFTTQAQFLAAGGIAAELANIEHLDTVARLEAAAAVRRLMLPGEMGESFKLMMLARGRPAELVTLPGRDLRHLL